MQEVHPFGSILFIGMRFIIVGTFPGRKYAQRSTAENLADEIAFSYGGRNQFWPIIEKLYSVLLHTRSEKIAFLHAMEIGMIDLYQIVERKKDSNLDQHLKAIVDNRTEIEKILRNGRTERVFCTGKQVATVLEKWFPEEKHLIMALPSPSPAYCSMSFEQKLDIYRQFFPKKCNLLTKYVKKC
jgi:G:T/U-mismatch repair DNA glycosylase